MGALEKRDLPVGFGPLIARTVASNVANSPGFRSLILGRFLRSTTPEGKCQSMSILRGVLFSPGRSSSFVSRVFIRGPMPLRVSTSLNRGCKIVGRIYVTVSDVSFSGMVDLCLIH